MEARICTLKRRSLINSEVATVVSLVSLSVIEHVSKSAMA